MSITEMSKQAYANSVEHGFYDGAPPNLSEKLMLIVSEIAEAMEEIRKPRMTEYGPLSADEWTSVEGKPEGFGIELADAVIRIGDLCGHLDIDLEGLIKLKMEYNASRPYKHNKAF